jgi:thymidylate kinase
VHNAYLNIAHREPQRVALIDARGAIGRTHKKILEAVRRKLKLGKN